MTRDGHTQALSRSQLGTGTTSVLDSARNHLHSPVGSMMSAQGCCAPRTSSGMICKPTVILAALVLCHSRNREALRDPVARSKEFKLGPAEFPRFLWEGEAMDTSDPTIGFLRHPILFAVRALSRFLSSTNATFQTGSSSLCHKSFKWHQPYLKHVNEGRVRETMWRQTCYYRIDCICGDNGIVALSPSCSR